MELSSHEEDIPIPLNTSAPYGTHHGHVHESHMIHHHHHHHPNSTPPPQNHIINISSSMDHDNNNNNPNSSSHNNQAQNVSIINSSSKKTVRYRECLKNHAASMGGNATDGCGEFIPNGEEGSIDALTCSACNCHRNFHRKEIEGEPINFLDNFNYHNINKFIRSKKLNNNLYLPPPPLPPPQDHHQLPLIGYPTSVIPSRGVSYNMGSILSDSDEHDDTNNNIHLMANRPQGVKKRFRTKFTQEQKEKMMQFAEKAGWKLQKQEESAVQQFCQEIGVKRRVLKVWMHNNKHNLAKKNLLSPTSNTT